MFNKNDKRVKVKICGIRDIETARAVVDAGADALGFVFARESKRYITPVEAREIIKSLDNQITTVGVFVETPDNEIISTAEYCGLSAVQVYKNIEARDKIPVIRALRVNETIDYTEIKSIDADAILLDTYYPGFAGGTGETFDWDLARGVSTELPLVLAGGLHPGNVAQAINYVRPFAVDVSSGVETGGEKDINKINQFIEKAKEVIL